MPNYMKPPMSMSEKPNMKREAKMAALSEILQMLGDMEAEPFMPKGVKAVEIGIMSKKPMGGDMEDMEGMEGMGAEGEKPEEEENGLELEAKGKDLEELKQKLAMLLK